MAKSKKVIKKKASKKKSAIIKKQAPIIQMKSKEERGKETIERVKNTHWPHTFIYNNMDPKVSSTNFSRFMNEKPGAVTEGLIMRINAFLDEHKV